MTSLLPARRLTDEDREYLTRWPTDCAEAVTRKHRGETWDDECGKLAVAARFDPEEGSAYPVCARHARGAEGYVAGSLVVYRGTHTACWTERCRVRCPHEGDLCHHAAAAYVGAEALDEWAASC